MELSQVSPRQQKTLDNFYIYKLKMVMNLMFIDDDLSTNFYHKVIVEEYGKVENFLFFSDATKAIQHLTTEIDHTYPDVIFLDLNMPKMDGWEFLEEYQKMKKDGNTKIIILSTTMNPNDVNRAKNHPLVYDFVTKPLTFELLNSLDKMLN